MAVGAFTTHIKEFVMSRALVQVLAILAAAFVFFIAWDLSQRVVLTVRLNETEQQLDRQIAVAQATRDKLREKKQYAQTDQFVEDEIRRRRWVRDGETLIIPLITPAAPVENEPLPLSPAPEPPFWESWLDFLFGP